MKSEISMTVREVAYGLGHCWQGAARAREAAPFASLGTMMTAYVYVLGCPTPTRYLTYVGWTLDLDRRLAEHNGSHSGARSTRGRIWVMLYAEQWPSRNEAMSREWHLKRDRPLRRRLAQAAQGQPGA